MIFEYLNILFSINKSAVHVLKQPNAKTSVDGRDKEGFFVLNGLQ